MNRCQVSEFMKLKIKNHQLQPVTLMQRCRKCIAKKDYNFAASIKHFFNEKEIHNNV